MDPFSIKKIVSRRVLIVVEGFWGAGKSTVARHLQKLTRAISVPEPINTDKKKTALALSVWYISAHKKNLKRALHKLHSRNRSVICERSILSSAAFEYAMEGHISDTMSKAVQEFCSHPEIIVIYLRPSSTLMRRGIFNLRDTFVLRQLRNNPRFISRYHSFFYTILPHNFSLKKIQYVTITDHTLKRVQKKKRDVSAAGVVIYKNKIVILYDKNHKQYVLPQGHQKNNESLVQTARREVIEETGFNDLIYRKKLYSYQYHFPRAYETIFKKIHAYLFELKTIKRGLPILEANESYKAHLVPIRSAITMLRWPQDRLVVKKTIREMKKLRSIVLNRSTQR